MAGARLRLAFFGTPAFAVPSLDALRAARHDIAGVYTRPPLPAGRGGRLTPSPVHAAAEAAGIAVRTPRTLKDQVAQAEFAALGLDAAVVVAYGLILPPPVLDAPRLGCLNIHASLLPRWRGAAPIQRAILAGDARTGITIMRMDESLDTGPMLLAEAVPIRAAETAGTLHDTLSALGARLIVSALEGLATGSLAARPQPGDGATYAAKLTREEERLDWARPAAELARRVRAFAPVPGAWFAYDGTRIKVRAAEAVAAGHEVVPGTLLDDALTVACGDGALRLLTVQREGRAPLAAADFLRGTKLPAGTQLG